MYQQKTGPLTEPLLVVLGSTGTGKSDLAVELAFRFDGEVINADAMQFYRGLPVTTNKISEAEQRGVPHHLLGVIGVDEEPWMVGRFKQEATRIIREIRSRGRLPIVVGGSQYYTDGLLFENHLVDEAVVDDDMEGDTGASAEIGSRYPILEASTEDILSRLREVDPAMAARWHPNDRRKIRRSLEIYLTTGRQASEIYAQQKQEKVKKQVAAQGLGDTDLLDGITVGPASAGPAPWKCLLLWVYAQRDVLNERLDARIDTMLSRGLMEEATEMHNILEDCRTRGKIIDRTKGIWQSIGLKELEPYLVALKEVKDAVGGLNTDVEATDDRLAQIQAASLDSMKFATRRYARYQLRWIKHKTIPMLAEERALDHLFLLDSTEREKWQENVAQVGVQLTAAFLARSGWDRHVCGRVGHVAQGDVSTLPAPVDVSQTARDVLTATIAASQSERESRNNNFSRTCEMCRMTLVSEDQWDKHIKGQRHRRVLVKQKRRALVPVSAVPKQSVEADMKTVVTERSTELNPGTDRQASFSRAKNI
ncbi:tRNA isopentenyltransferase [Grosmannia clavigera kw1407]|uniref:tRNA dimethylallyltransferase n=1 Tax=Grosmannia clavigera (strain kw1407 / UAMH 11150) TaxID=655863 RepID=F0XCG1_GROCL|nr:tRNA isopentenyltransferase [Grosmannia clavigera kw1407]EFX03887.1 tRNA isopentenyltransferase [Grosmannia clavigera kw1407]